ncbi:MAG: hypothetical protein U9N54_00035 [candidate division Zixibacteria bacterium]|nr:hypothetical protein [candidate division Zixibacteria bacterium]
MLPKVPACVECNNQKSKIEHYLLSVLPFGATHSNAQKALSVDTAKRLTKNRKLHRKLKIEFGYKYVPTKEGCVEKQLTISLDHKILHEFIGFVGRGLIWYHWKKYLPTGCAYKAFTPSPIGLEFLSGLFNLSTSYRVNNQLGDGTVRYKGVMSEIDEGLSIWAIQLLGGMTFSDRKAGHVFSNSFVAMITGFPKTLENLM